MPQKPSTGSSNKQAQQGSNQNSGTKMTQEAASRIQSAADRHPNSTTSQTGFKERAQSNAAKNENNKK
ncbi:hypothetical protein EC991_007887 [Linnemannia zychae]|nr:hypothetical protein EC991_007887 [Linnemannia zychae]